MQGSELESQYHKNEQMTTTTTKSLAWTSRTLFLSGVYKHERNNGNGLINVTKCTVLQNTVECKGQRDVTLSRFGEVLLMEVISGLDLIDIAKLKFPYE